jgi:hypothetical protein
VVPLEQGNARRGPMYGRAPPLSSS